MTVSQKLKNLKTVASVGNTLDFLERSIISPLNNEEGRSYLNLIGIDGRQQIKQLSESIQDCRNTLKSLPKVVFAGGHSSGKTASLCALLGIPNSEFLPVAAQPTTGNIAEIRVSSDEIRNDLPIDSPDIEGRLCKEIRKVTFYISSKENLAIYAQHFYTEIRRKYPQINLPIFDENILNMDNLSNHVGTIKGKLRSIQSNAIEYTNLIQFYAFLVSLRSYLNVYPQLPKNNEYSLSIIPKQTELQKILQLPSLDIFNIAYIDDTYGMIKQDDIRSYFWICEKVVIDVVKPNFSWEKLKQVAIIDTMGIKSGNIRDAYLTQKYLQTAHAIVLFTNVSTIDANVVTELFNIFAANLTEQEKRDIKNRTISVFNFFEVHTPLPCEIPNSINFNDFSELEKRIKSFISPDVNQYGAATGFNILLNVTQNLSDTYYLLTPAVTFKENENNYIRNFDNNKPLYEGLRNDLISIIPVIENYEDVKKYRKLAVSLENYIYDGGSSALIGGISKLLSENGEKWIVSRAIEVISSSLVKFEENLIPRITKFDEGRNEDIEIVNDRKKLNILLSNLREFYRFFSNKDTYSKENNESELSLRNELLTICENEVNNAILTNNFFTEWEHGRIYLTNIDNVYDEILKNLREIIIVLVREKINILAENIKKIEIKTFFIDDFINDNNDTQSNSFSLDKLDKELRVNLFNELDENKWKLFISFFRLEEFTSKYREEQNLFFTSIHELKKPFPEFNIERAWNGTLNAKLDIAIRKELVYQLNNYITLYLSKFSISLLEYIISRKYELDTNYNSFQELCADWKPLVAPTGNNLNNAIRFCTQLLQTWITWIDN